MWILLFISILHTAAGQDCTFPESLWGSWTTTNLGTVNISSGTPSMTTTLTLTGATGTIDFNCMLIDGSQYVLQSTSQISVFSGTTNVYAYMCMDLRQASTYAYYFYMNSGEEVGFGGMRMVGLASTTATVAQVCTTTLVPEEFHTMVKVGNEEAAIDAVQCPDNLLGQFYYTYQDSTGTYCDNVNTSLINSCTSQNLTTIQVNNTGCTAKNPFFSSNGLLGCLVSVYNSSAQIYYTSLYNLDSTLAAGTTYRFTCVASAVDSSDPNGTVLLSMVHTDCNSGQDTTTLPTLPTNGALMVLKPELTCTVYLLSIVVEERFSEHITLKSTRPFVGHTIFCVPTTTTTTTPPEDTSTTWLIPFLVLIAFFIVLVIVGICLYLRHRKFLREKAREKKTLISDEHPLGEISISLDAPASLERVAMVFDETDGIDRFKTPRSGKKGMTNPLSESSLNLDFKGRSWSTFYRGKGTKSPQGMDPFTEMDNGMVVPLSQRGSKTPRSVINQRQKSFVSHGKAKSMVNGHTTKHLSITDGREVYPDFENPDIVERLATKSVKSMKTVYDPEDKFTDRAPNIATRINKPRSIKAPSVKTPSTRAPSLKVSALKAPPSLKAPSVKAPSVKARSMKSVSMRAPSVKSANTTKSKVSRLTRSLTTTKIGSITKRLTSPRKKALTRSSTVVVPSKEHPADETEENLADFLDGEMAITRAPSEAGKSRHSTRSRASKSGSKTPRKKVAQPSVVKLPEQMTDEQKIDELMRVNTQLVQGTTSPTAATIGESFFKTPRTKLSKSVLKPKASKKPWRGN